MKRKLIITTLGIASLGINSVLTESVYSQIIENNKLYNCYFQSTFTLAGQVLVSNDEFPSSVCNAEIRECLLSLNGCYAEPANL